MWDEQALFDEAFEAGPNGSYARNYLRFMELSSSAGEIHAEYLSKEPLTDDQNEMIDVVLDLYGKKSGRLLSEMTHDEEP